MAFDLDASAMIAFLRVEVLVDPESRCYAHSLNLWKVFSAGQTAICGVL